MTNIVAVNIGQDDWFDLYVDRKLVERGHSLRLSEAGELLVNRLSVTEFRSIYLERDAKRDNAYFVENFLIPDDEWPEYSFPNEFTEDQWEQLILNTHKRFWH